MYHFQHTPNWYNLYGPSLLAFTRLTRATEMEMALTRQNWASRMALFLDPRQRRHTRGVSLLISLIWMQFRIYLAAVLFPVFHSMTCKLHSSCVIFMKSLLLDSTEIFSLCRFECLSFKELDQLTRKRRHQPRHQPFFSEVWYELDDDVANLQIFPGVESVPACSAQCQVRLRQN